MKWEFREDSVKPVTVPLPQDPAQRPRTYCLSLRRQDLSVSLSELLCCILNVSGTGFLLIRVGIRLPALGPEDNEDLEQSRQNTPPSRVWGIFSCKSQSLGDQKKQPHPRLDPEASGGPGGDGHSARPGCPWCAQSPRRSLAASAWG